MSVDLAIINGRILDGTGKPAYWGEVGIEGPLISYAGPAGDLSARRTIDAQGMAVCPGFIDVKTERGQIWYNRVSETVIAPIAA